MKRRRTWRRIAGLAMAIFSVTAAQSAAGQASTTGYEDTWSALGGPLLQRYLRAGIAESPALAEAWARVRLADSAAREAGADRLPGAVARLSHSNARDADRGLRVDEISRARTSSWSGGIELQYTFDMWGRAAATARAAGAEAEAVRLDHEGARTLLARDIVQTFAEIAQTDARLATLGQSIGDGREMLRLTQVRFDNGVASTLDVEAATAELERLLIAEREVTRSRASARARLAALVGEDPLATITDESFAEALVRSAPAPGAWNVRDLKNRPDLRAIELRALASGFRVTAAHAALYPDFTLSAGVSTAAREFAEAFDARFLAANLVTGLTGPLFDGGRRRARLAGAQADAERIAAEQRGALLRAAQEVVEAQSSLSGLAGQRAAASRRVTAQERVVRLLEERRAAGTASLLDVLRERAALISATEDVARLAADELAAVARLLAATGSSPAPPN